MKSKFQKRDEVPERLAAWRELTPAQQLADLDRRLGKGVGANRQRTKLAAALAAVSVPPLRVVVPPAAPQPLEAMRPAIYDPEHYPEDAEPQQPRKRRKGKIQRERHEA